MSQQQSTPAQMQVVIKQLAGLTERSDARLQALEQRRRWQPLLVLGVLLAGYLAGLLSAGQNSAEAGQPAVQQTAEQAGAARSSATTLVQRVKGAASRDLGAMRNARRADEQRFDALMEDVRKHANMLGSKGFDPARGIAVILHDMKKLLEAMPSMAEDMHAMRNDMGAMSGAISTVPMMARDVNVMSQRVGEMSYGVNSTLGRMGSMMPW